MKHHLTVQETSGHGAALNRRRARWFFFAIVLSLMWTVLPAPGSAKPGTHGRAVSTWDTTRSTVVFDYRRGFLLGGGFANNAGYNANFTSTTGRLSAQFGLQYLNLGPDDISLTMHGVAGSVIALYALPMGSRYDNGMPKAAFAFYGGSVPSVLSNGEHTYTTFPITFGIGVEINPIRHLSIIPWVEGAPSFNLDTIIRYEEFQNRISEGTVDDVYIEYGPNGEIVDVQVADGVIDDLVADVIDYKFIAAFRIRGGLSLVLNLGDKIDLQINGTVAQMGSDFDAPPTIFVGGALAFAWDDPPLGILPEEQRANSLSCKSVAARFQSCGEYRALVEQIRQEELKKLKANQKKGIVVVDPDAKPAPKKAESPENKPLSPTAVGTPASETPTTPPPPMNPPEESVTTPVTPTPVTPAPTEPVKPATPPASDTGKSGLPSLSQPIMN